MKFTRAILACIVACQSLVAQAASTFDVASIKPSLPGVRPPDCNTLPGGVFVCHNVRIDFLLRLAFHLKYSTIKGAPAWLEETIDLDAKAEGGGELTQEELSTRLLTLFRERFGLVAHEGIVKETVWVLEQQAAGAKLKPSSQGTAASSQTGDEAWLFKGLTMQAFAASLATRPDVNARVIDNTGLIGQFDFAFPYVNAGGNGGASADNGVSPAVARRSASAYSSILDALLSVGLRLREEKRDTTVLVIDQIHRPSEN
ncbi:MAG: TIGR03435 family protein [Bryobacteraceae bacterium]